MVYLSDVSHLEWLEIIYNYITKTNKTCLTKYGVFTWKHFFKKEAQKQAGQFQDKKTVDVLLDSPVKQHIKAVHTTSQCGMK